MGQQKNDTMIAPSISHYFSFPFLFASVILFFTSVVSIFLVDAYFLNLKKDGWVCHICQFDSELGWENKPNEKVTNNKITYTTNSLGLRSEEIDPSKEHIVVLGDSVAMGVGVNDNETVSYYIQQETSKYQVITLAATGHSVDQYYLNLKKHLPKLNPKYIVPIIFSGNDWVETIQDDMWQIDKPFYKIEDGDLKRKPPKVIIKFVFASINLYSQDFGISRILEAESRKLSLASLTPLSKNLKLKK